jgi:hypothetical protein
MLSVRRASENWPFLFDQIIPVLPLKKTPLFFEFDYTRNTILIFFKDKNYANGKKYYY